MAIPSWLSLSSKSGTGNKAINATAAVNKNASRSYVLTVTAGGITKTVNCVQKAANKFTLTLTCITFDSKGNVIQNVGKVSHGTDPTAGILQRGYYPDTSVQISAATNITGYHFKTWTENETPLSIDNPLTVVMTKDRTIQAEYAINTYTVKAENEDDTKGSVSVTLNGSVLENNIAVYGQSVVFKATRKTGSKFVGWYDKTTEQLVSESHIYNFVVNKDLTLVAVWAAYHVNDTIKISPNGAGTVSPNPITGIEGTNISTKAIANDGYIFDKWIYNTASSSTGFAESTNNPVNWTVTGSRDITAVFAKTYTVETSSSPTSYGSTSPISSSVKEGNSITLTATPGGGFKFIKWIDEDTSEEYTDNPLTITINKNTTLKAKFGAETYSTIAKIEPTDSGTVTPNPVVGEYGSKVTITAKANDGYIFDHWHYRDYGIVYVDRTNNPLEYPIIGDDDLTAVFAKKYEVKLQSSNLGYGNVDPMGSQFVKDGSSFIATAYPNDGYEFVKWVDKNTSEEYTNNPLTITITKDTTLIANFKASAVSNTVKIEPTGTGTVSPNPLTGTTGSKVKATATPTSGYVFEKWKYKSSNAGNYSEYTANPYNFTLYKTNDIIAVFTKLHTISVKLGDATNITDSTGTVHTESYVVTRKHGTKFIIPSATKNSTVAYNYTFKHFVDNAGKTYAAGTEITVTSDLQLTPVFESKLNKYSYKFYNHTGATLIKTVTKDYGTTISSSEIPTAPTLSGYTFVGWFDTKSANGNKLDDNLTVKGDKTWYAVYSETKVKVTIIAATGGRVEGDGFDSNGVLYAVPGTKVEIRAIPDAGNVFFKWNDQVTDAIRTITVGSSDVEYVAMFEVASLNLNVTQLVFDSNGGTQTVVVTATVNWTVS